MAQQRHVPRTAAEREAGARLMREEWDGPVFGARGVLAQDAERLQCHACGEWYRHLGSHAFHGHGLLAKEYRTCFGLRARTSLIAPDLQAWKREHSRSVLSRYWGNTLLADLPADKRGGHRWPLEALLDPRRAESRREAARKGGETTRRRIAAGELQRPQPQPRDRAAALAKAQARRRERLQDPEHRAQVSRNIAAGRRRGRHPGGGGPTPQPCLSCGTPFISRTGRRTCSPACEAARRRAPRKERTPSACAVCGAPVVSPSERKTCSAVCQRAYLRAERAQHPRAMRPESRAKLRQTRLQRRLLQAAAVASALAAHGSARLTARDRELVARFYGLGDGRLWPPAELMAAYRLSEDGVHAAVRNAVAKLLAAAPERQ